MCQLRGGIVSASSTRRNRFAARCTTAGRALRSSSAAGSLPRRRGRDTACSPRKAPPRRSYPRDQDLSPRSSANRLFNWQHALQDLLPCRDSTLRFVLIKAIEYVAPQIEPDVVGVVGVHHLAPHFDGQPE